ncbi:MAG: Crp/Fnr family transcriptional regulator [Acidimicrobiales bacterium]
MSDLELLKNVQLFDGFSDEEFEQLATALEVHTIHRNDALFAEGDSPDQLYVVVSGRIAITRGFIDGKESVFALMEPGDLFGDMGLFDGLGRSADARALETSRILVIGYAPLKKIYTERPILLWRVVQMLAERLRNMDDALADSMFLDVAGRTAKRLLELAGDSDEFTLPVTQEELAGMVGASRERVNKALASFVRLGWLSQNDRRYAILERDSLTLRSR